MYVQMRLQVQNVSGFMDLHVSELSFEHAEGNIVPFKDINHQWVFSVPPDISGTFVIKGVKSNLVSVKQQYICVWDAQKVICNES